MGDMRPAVGPPFEFWTVVPYEYGVELHCPTCGTPYYFDGRTIALVYLTASVDAHRCPIGAGDD